ncbi:MAG: right-handed parallel beta-helix repeat-containing protein [Thermoanaerobaculia bacterium]
MSLTFLRSRTARAGAGLALLALTLVLPMSLTAAEFHVSPTGRPAGDGSAQNPWDLRTALAHPASVRPGDTIWLRGGTYPGSYQSVLRGTSGAPIKVRQYPGERATLQGNEPRDVATLTVRGGHAWYMGFEITNTASRRSFGPGSSAEPFGDGLLTLGDHLKLINLVIHDNSQGVQFTSRSPDSELYGCLIYYNGTVGTDRGHGHAIYTQNETGAKRIVDNLIFMGFAGGMHIYGSSVAHLNNFEVRGNTFFQQGELHEGTNNWVMGGTTGNPGLTNLVFSGNYGYNSGKASGGGSVGFYSPCRNVLVSNNYLASHTRSPLLSIGKHCNTAEVRMRGNFLYGRSVGFSSSSFPDNTYLLGTTPPTGTRVFVRPNQYEPGRANITVFNWDHRSTVDVNVGSILPVGARYELRNSQDFFGPPVLSGTYDGRPLRVPMSGLRTATPHGWPAPRPTGPEFNAFVLMRTR